MIRMPHGQHVILGQCLPCGNKEISINLKLNLDFWMLSMIVVKMIVVMEHTSCNDICDWKCG